MAVNPYQFQDYRSLVKAKVKDLRAASPRFSLRFFAQRIPVQYTYLSRVLNTGKSHLSEDHLHRLGKLFDFNDDEIEYLLLLRARDATSEVTRRDYLTKKIEDLSKKRSVSAQYKKPSFDENSEMGYLLNPHAVLVHLALYIEEYRKNPAQLSSLLGISRQQLKEVLLLLEKNKFIETGETPFEVKSVSQQKIHYGREHPLMRTHQVLQRTMHEARLILTSEEDKESLNATFTMDQNGLEEAKKLTKKYLSEMQKIASQSRARHVYQLSLSLLKWF